MKVGLPWARRGASPRTAAALAEPRWLEWAAIAGILTLALWLLGGRGVWGLLLSSDPTGLTLVIIVVFLASTLWCTTRSRELQQQRAALDLLLEQTHGAHHTAWRVDGIQLKLGLLGKVIGFSILALQIGNMQNFDPAQSQELLKNLTTGLGVALLSTVVGPVGNILLGLKLTRLARYADALVAEAQRNGLSRTRSAD